MSVTKTRAPLAPMGCPMATAPPFTFILLGSRLSSRITPKACTEKASLSSYRSTSSFFQPVFSQIFRTALTGAIITHLGSTPLVACATIRAMGFAPSSFARVALVTTTAAAPSFTPGALPAVTVPSFLNAGFRDRRTSIVVSSRGDSSLSKMTDASPFFLEGSSTGTICD